MSNSVPSIGWEPRPERPAVLELVYSGILVLAFLFIGWFSVYVVYKLYQGQR
jgi:hypothetical protein